MRLAERRGWPLSEQFVRDRVTTVATNIAEVKGARMDSSSQIPYVGEETESVIRRIRTKITEIDG